MLGTYNKVCSEESWKLNTEKKGIMANMDKNERQKQLTLRLPEHLHREFKVNTAKKGQSMGEVAVELIRKYLDGAMKD